MNFQVIGNAQTIFCPQPGNFVSQLINNIRHRFLFLPRRPANALLVNSRGKGDGRLSQSPQAWILNFTALLATRLHQPLHLNLAQ